MDDVEEKIGQWQVCIPDTAKMCWDKWDILAFDLTLTELMQYGDVATFWDAQDRVTTYRGDFIESYRRLVGEGVSRLVGLAKVGVSERR